MKFQVGAGLLLVSSTFGHEGHHHHGHHDHRMRQDDFDDHNFLRPHTHVAYHHVEKACAAEVESLCTPREAPKPSGDPLWDWMFVSDSSSAPMELDDISFVMDRMFESVFALPVTFVYATYPEKEYTVQDINFVIDSTAGKLVENSNEEDIPELAQKIQHYGAEMLTRIGSEEDDHLQYRMARRLTEMDANKMKHHFQMPFGCQKNACLLDAMNQNKLGKKCLTAIKELEIISRVEIEIEQRHETMLNMMNIYLVLLFAVLVLLIRKSRSHKVRRRMRNRILQAIYSNPELKKQVEEELGESVGVIPPMPYLALKLMSAGGRDLKRGLRCAKRIHILFFTVLTVLVVVAPMVVFPICIMITFVRLVHLCFLNDDDISRECQCCCCGATTTDVLYGTLTEEQECCGCCKGTGICAPACKDCCGPDACCNRELQSNAPECQCCCCGATTTDALYGTLTKEQECCGCCKGTGTCAPSCKDCCGPGACCNKKKASCFGGSSCCCCCGATGEDAKAGLLTEVQACCSCCSGTGCCSCCCSCCGPTPKGRGQKHVFKPTECIYEGVPLQVV